MGRLRLARPEPLDGPWKGTLEATDYGSMCFQPQRLSSYLFTTGDEDCLYLNVFVPRREEEEDVRARFKKEVHR